MKNSSNQGMSLDEFKRIWYMEYFHRMWGRAIGVVYFLPAGYFLARGYFNKGMKIRTGVLGGLLIFQVRFILSEADPRFKAAKTEFHL